MSRFQRQRSWSDSFDDGYPPANRVPNMNDGMMYGGNRGGPRSTYYPPEYGPAPGYAYSGRRRQSRSCSSERSYSPRRRRRSSSCSPTRRRNGTGVQFPLQQAPHNLTGYPSPPYNPTYLSPGAPSQNSTYPLPSQSGPPSTTHPYNNSGSRYQPNSGYPQMVPHPGNPSAPYPPDVDYPRVPPPMYGPSSYDGGGPGTGYSQLRGNDPTGYLSAGRQMNGLPGCCSCRKSREELDRQQQKLWSTGVCNDLYCNGCIAQIFQRCGDNPKCLSCGRIFSRTNLKSY